MFMHIKEFNNSSFLFHSLYISFFIYFILHIIYMDRESDEYEYEPDYNYDNVKQTFYISRHLNSCNNMVDDAKWTNVTYKFTEPPLSMWGIISGLALQRKLLGTFNNKVYVSCLVRTWMTAIIEYFPHTSGTLDLIVSPYIKEADLSNKYNVGQTIDSGNMPINVKEQVEKIKYFFYFLRLIKKYMKKYSDEFKSLTIDGIKIDENIYNNNILKIQENLDKILKDGNKINIIFPTFSMYKRNKKVYIDYKISLKYDESINKLVSTFELREDKKYVNPYEVDPYFYRIKKEQDFTLKLEDPERLERNQDGGDNSEINYNYFISVLKAFLKQKNLIKSEPEDIELSGFKSNNKPLKIINTLKKSGFFSRIPKVGIYTTSFGKESMLLFIDWIKNVMKDDDDNIYVVAHSNIMQETLYNICGTIKNRVVKKKNVEQTCQEGLYNIVKKQNIWELILEVDRNEESITNVKVRRGQEKANEASKQVLNYNREKELSCGKNIENLENIEKMPIKVTQNKNKVPPRASNITEEDYYQEEEPVVQPPPKTFFGKIGDFFRRRGGRKCTMKHKRRQKNKTKNDRRMKTRKMKTRKMKTRRMKTRRIKTRRNKRV